jgi:hypothetical protein
VVVQFEYRLCVQVERPEIRRITLTALHANIQDVFNEFGVQIILPHYENDPMEKIWCRRSSGLKRLLNRVRMTNRFRGMK